MFHQTPAQQWSHSGLSSGLIRLPPINLKPWIDLTRISYFAGTMVVFWPFAWGLTMAARTLQLPLPQFASLFVSGFFGACLSHSSLSVSTFMYRSFQLGAGCVWNDILDRDFDAQVARTKLRPMAARKISVPGASIFLCVHLVLMVSLIWKVNPLAWTIGLVSIFPLAGCYPFMKRITYWPQAWLGIAINPGITMSWATTSGAVPKSALALYGACWSWTLWYDTIYACQDKKDDVKAGVKSTAVLFGARVKTILSFFGILVIAGLVVSGVWNHQTWPYYLFSVVGGAIHLFWQMYTVDVDSPKSCWSKFHCNAFYFGGIVELGLFLDYLLATISKS